MSRCSLAFMSALALFALTSCGGFFAREKMELDALGIPLGVARTERVYFASGEYKLEQQGKNILTELAKQMSENEGITLLVVGHTDPKGAEEYNFALGEKRADAVKRFLVECDKSFAPRIKTLSKGELEPEVLVYSKNFKEVERAYAQNRRAVITVIESNIQSTPKAETDIEQLLGAQQS